MKSWSLLRLFFIGYLYFDFAHSSTVVEEKPLHSKCSRKCQESNELTDQKQNPLYRCSCSPSCAIYGDCCVDSPYRNETLRQEIDFMCLSIVGRGRVRAVSGCPTREASGYCKSAIGHLRPVTSKATHTTFANTFCAACNGVYDDLVAWNVELRCSDRTGDSLNGTMSGAEVGDAFSEAEDDAIVYESGNLWKYSSSTKSRSICTYHVHYEDYALIDSLELRSCDVVPRVVDCSPSWTDTDVIGLCRSYEDPVYFGNVVYRNLHCAACNYLVADHASCMPHSMEVLLRLGLADPGLSEYCGQRTSCEWLTHRGRPYAFAMLLNIREKACVPPKGRRCCAGERFDFRSKRCRKVVKGRTTYGATSQKR